MKLDDGELVATGAELAAAPAVFDLVLGDLARLPRVPNTVLDQERVKEFFEGLSEEFAIMHKAAVATLANPSRIGVMHYTLGEESISRAILAWGKPTGSRVVLMVSGGGEGWRIRVEPVDSLVKTISSVLLERIPLLPVDIRCSVTQEAALVFLAVHHLLREARMLALLSHRDPASAFGAESVEEVLNDSGTEDFRWPFFFLDKVLPFSANGVSWGESIPPALEELAARDLLRKSGNAEGQAWELTQAGYRVFLATHHHLTKVGLRITELDESGRKAHEALLLIRSLQDLFLFDLAGREAAVASVDMEGMRKLVGQMLSLDGMAADASAMRSCPACAARIPAAAAVCPECGMALAASPGNSPPEAMDGPSAAPPLPPPPLHPEMTPPPRRPRKPVRKRRSAASWPPAMPQPPARPAFCANCGAELAPGTKFCGGCGHPVSQ